MCLTAADSHEEAAASCIHILQASLPAWSSRCAIVFARVTFINLSGPWCVCVCARARARVAKPEPVIRLDAFSVLIAGGMEDESAGQIALHIGSLSLICFLLRQKARLVFALSYSMHAGRQKQQAAQVDVRHV